MLDDIETSLAAMLPPSLPRTLGLQGAQQVVRRQQSGGGPSTIPRPRAGDMLTSTAERPPRRQLQHHSSMPPSTSGSAGEAEHRSLKFPGLAPRATSSDSAPRGRRGLAQARHHTRSDSNLRRQRVGRNPFGAEASGSTARASAAWSSLGDQVRGPSPIHSGSARHGRVQVTSKKSKDTKGVILRHGERPDVPVALVPDGSLPSDGAPSAAGSSASFSRSTSDLPLRSAARPGIMMSNRPPDPMDHAAISKPNDHYSPVYRHMLEPEPSAIAPGPGADSFDYSSLREKLEMAELVNRKLYRKNQELEEVVSRLKGELSAIDALAAPDSSRSKTKPKSAGVAGGSVRTSQSGHGEESDDQDGSAYSSDSDFVDESDGEKPAGEAAGRSPEEEDGAGKPELLEAFNSRHIDHLKFIISTKDREIETLRQKVMAAKQKSTGPDAAGPVKASAVRLAEVERLLATSQHQLQEALADTERYREGYERLKAEYRTLVRAGTKPASKKLARGKRGDPWGTSLRSGGASLTSASTSSGRGLDSLDFVRSLSERLAASEKEREEEAIAFNKKLLAAENANCDWFVEKRLLLSRVSELTAQLRERDKIEEKVEICVSALFDHVSRVEAENTTLQRALLVAKKNAPTGC